MKVAARTLTIAALSFLVATAAQAQTGSSSQTPTPAPAQAQTPEGPINGAYVASDPLAGVRYDNRYDVSLGMAYGRLVAGPNLREGSSMGGLDLSSSYWLTKHWGIEGSARAYVGTTGTTPSAAGYPYNESGVLITQYMFLAGAEYLGPHNKHIALIPHALVGGVYGDFNRQLGEAGSKTGPTGIAGIYDNQTTLAGAIGGHIDLNRSAHWVFRVTPDALLTGYDGTSQYSHTQWNFGISVGVQYKFKMKR